MTHTELVVRAVKWLKNTKHCRLVLCKPRTVTLEQPDAIGWKMQPFSTLIECKASRGDFLADRKKWFREHPHKGMGYNRYFMTPAGLVTRDEVPKCWGLLEVKGRIVSVTKKPTPFVEWNLKEEMSLLLSRFVHGIEPHEDTSTDWGEL